jgi:hypothetical protein
MRIKDAHFFGETHQSEAGGHDGFRQENRV